VSRRSLVTSFSSTNYYSCVCLNPCQDAQEEEEEEEEEEDLFVFNDTIEGPRVSRQTFILGARIQILGFRDYIYLRV
jgi:hypothetical protein